jgi:hypothetical protein
MRILEWRLGLTGSAHPFASRDRRGDEPRERLRALLHVREVGVRLSHVSRARRARLRDARG